MAGDAFLLLHYFQAPQITARDILEYAESEFRDYGQHMVEYVGLNAFVRNPVFHGIPVSVGCNWRTMQVSSLLTSGRLFR